MPTFKSGFSFFMSLKIAVSYKGTKIFLRKNADAFFLRYIIATSWLKNHFVIFEIAKAISYDIKKDVRPNSSHIF